MTVNFLTGRWTFMIWQIKLVIKELDFFSFMTKHKIMPHCMAENKRNIADVFVEPWFISETSAEVQAWLPFSRNGRVAKFFSVSVLNGYLFSTMLFCRFQVDILVEIGKQCLPFISVLKINHLDCDYNSCPRIKWQPQKLSGPWDS